MKNKIIKSFLFKSMISILLFLIFLIGIKTDKDFEKIIYKSFYHNNISFAKFNDTYNKLFGDLFPLNNISDLSVEVFNEKINYLSFNEYKDGVLLTLEDGYLVPFIDDGIIIFKGYKKDYGNVIVVQNSDDLEIWYCNIKNNNINLYEYVEKGDYVGEVDNNKLVLVFYRNGEIEDYKKYI